MKTKTIKLISRWVVILIILIGASCVAVGIVQANAQDSLSGALMLGFELDNLPVERLSERDAVDAEGTHYGLISTGGNALIHYTGYYNTIENKYVHLTDPTGEPQITGDYLMLDDAKILFENGAYASKRDLRFGTPVLVESDYTLESYPGQMHCTKIVILK